MKQVQNSLTCILVGLSGSMAGLYLTPNKGSFDLEWVAKCLIVVSALTFANTHYLLSKHQKLDEARKILIKFKVLVEVSPLDDKIVELALVSDFKDFEDAIQYHTALENGIDIIITRNKKDFKNSKLPIMTAKEYLKK